MHAGGAGGGVEAAIAADHAKKTRGKFIYDLEPSLAVYYISGWPAFGAVNRNRQPIKIASHDTSLDKGCFYFLIVPYSGRVS